MMDPRVQPGLAKIFADSAAAAKMQPLATRPFSIRLSTVERRQLEQEAGAQPLGTYVRARLLNSAKQRQASRVSADPALLGQILGKLGRMQLASTLSDLSTAAIAGAIAMTPEREQEVRAACRDIRRIRDLLMQALGLKPDACP